MYSKVTTSWINLSCSYVLLYISAEFGCTASIVVQHDYVPVLITLFAITRLNSSDMRDDLIFIRYQLRTLTISQRPISENFGKGLSQLVCGCAIFGKQVAKLSGRFEWNWFEEVDMKWRDNKKATVKHVPAPPPYSRQDKRITGDVADEVLYTLNIYPYYYNRQNATSSSQRRFENLFNRSFESFVQLLREPMSESYGKGSTNGACNQWRGSAATTHIHETAKTCDEENATKRAHTEAGSKETATRGRCYKHRVHFLMIGPVSRKR